MGRIKEYIVYDEDSNVIVSGTADVCAETLGVSKKTFLEYKSHQKQGKYHNGMGIYSYDELDIDDIPF